MCAVLAHELYKVNPCGICPGVLQSVSMALSKRTLLLLAVSSCLVILACCQDAAATTAAANSAEPAAAEKYHDKKDKYDDKHDKYESKHDKVRESTVPSILTTSGARNEAGNGRSITCPSFELMH